MSATLSQSQIAALGHGFMDANVLLVAVKLGLFGASASAAIAYK